MPKTKTKRRKKAAKPRKPSYTPGENMKANTHLRQARNAAKRKARKK